MQPLDEIALCEQQSFVHHPPETHGFLFTSLQSPIDFRRLQNLAECEVHNEKLKGRSKMNIPFSQTFICTYLVEKSSGSLQLHILNYTSWKLSLQSLTELSLPHCYSFYSYMFNQIDILVMKIYLLHSTGVHNFGRWTCAFSPKCGNLHLPFACLKTELAKWHCTYRFESWLQSSVGIFFIS